MRNHLRFWAVLFIASPLAAMAFEPFFAEILRRLGWDSSKWVAPVLNTAAAIVNWPWFPIVATASIAFGLGVLADLYAKWLDGLLALVRGKARDASNYVERHWFLKEKLADISSNLAVLHRLTPRLEDAYSDKIERNESEQAQLDSDRSEWELALGRIEHALSQCGHDVNFYARRPPPLSQWPIHGHGRSEYGGAREARLFWQRHLAFNDTFGIAHQAVIDEAKALQRSLETKARR